LTVQAISGKCDDPISFDLALLRLAEILIKNHLSMPVPS
jgi:hypothetical protein